MCAYFKLPRWLTNFGTDIVEKDHDPPDVKALKVSTAKCVFVHLSSSSSSQHVLILTILESTEVPAGRQ